MSRSGWRPWRELRSSVSSFLLRPQLRRIRSLANLRSTKPSSCRARRSRSSTKGSQLRCPRPTTRSSSIPTMRAFVAPFATIRDQRHRLLEIIEGLEEHGMFSLDTRRSRVPRARRSTSGRATACRSRCCSSGSRARPGSPRPTRASRCRRRGRTTGRSSLRATSMRWCVPAGVKTQSSTSTFVVRRAINTVGASATRTHSACSIRTWAPKRCFAPSMPQASPTCAKPRACIPTLRACG